MSLEIAALFITIKCAQRTATEGEMADSPDGKSLSPHYAAR
jgi:hypothetical protein